MPDRQAPPPLSAALTALRNARGMTERDLAEAAGISTKAVSVYERKREPSRERLEELAAAMGYGPEAVDWVLLGLARAVAADLEGPAGPGSPVEPATRQRRRLRREAARLGLAAAEALEAFGLKAARERRARRARRRAARLWQELDRATPAERRLLVEASREHQTWAVAERLCHESAEAAADRTDLALELAELALRAAELAPGEEVWRRRLLGYARFFRANALRVQGELAAAEAEVTRARALWEEGAPADPGLLPPWRPLDLEASLHRGRRRFAAALDLLDQALNQARAAGAPAAAGRILLKKAATLDQMGDPERAVAALAEAAPLVDGRREPRLLFGLRFNLAASLVKLGRPAEAAALLSEVRRRAAALGNGLDSVRTGWLAGQVAAGLGRAAEAEAAFSRARREFHALGLAYDHALASLDLAVLYLDQGRAPEVRDLARQTLAAFAARSVHREALAALELFREAAEREEATAELARRLATYLCQARRDPALRFEP